MSEKSEWVRVTGVHPQWSESEEKTYAAGAVRSTASWAQEDYDLLLNMGVIEPCDPPTRASEEKKGK